MNLTEKRPASLRNQGSVTCPRPERRSVLAGKVSNGKFPCTAVHIY